jgi:acyl-coenzyme A synthetase/AMP-(fatty) acid ligase
VSLTQTFLAVAESRREAPAIIDADGRVLSYAGLVRASARRAQAYEECGVGKGDVVLVARGVDSELYVVLLALYRLGAIAMFPEPGAGLAGVRHALAARPPRAMIGGLRARLARALAPELARLPLLPSQPRNAPRGDGPLASASTSSPALITFTSGSTGRPKGIVRSGDCLLLQHRLLEDVLRSSVDDVDLISLPVFVLSNLAVGAASVIPAGDLRRPAGMSGARLRRQIAAHGVTRVLAPPALCAQLADGSSLDVRAIFTGGGPVFPNLWRKLREAAPGARLCAIYGSTEAEPIAHVEWDEISSGDWRAMANGAGLLAGRPIAEIALGFDADEIEVAGPHVNRGYLNSADDAATKVIRDGVLWHRTGDCGRLDQHGRLWLLGRKAAAGAGAYPFALETAALSWPGVEAAALLARRQEGPYLAVAGQRLDVADLRRRARALAVADIVRLPSIPTDMRHNSKVDYVRLQAAIARAR